jgi:hypothetical protein
MVSKKVGDCDKRMDDEHADYPPSFRFIGNPSIYDCINNHPYFKGEYQYSNYNDNWQPYTQVQYMVSIHTCIVIAARAAGPASGPGRWCHEWRQPSAVRLRARRPSDLQAALLIHADPSLAAEHA